MNPVDSDVEKSSFRFLLLAPETASPLQNMLELHYLPLWLKSYSSQKINNSKAKAAVLKG